MIHESYPIDMDFLIIYCLISVLEHLVPPQVPQMSVQTRLKLRHEHFLVLQSVLQLQKIVLSSFSGAGGSAVNLALYLFPRSSNPYSSGGRSYPIHSIIWRYVRKECSLLEPEKTYINFN